MARIHQYGSPIHYPSVPWEIDQARVRAGLALRRNTYWMPLAVGRAIGLNKGKSWRWMARFTVKGMTPTYRYKSLGYSEDSPHIKRRYMRLTFDAAVELAQEWFSQFDDGIDPRPIHERGTPPPERLAGSPYTVAHALIDFLWHLHDSGADWRRAHSIFRLHVILGLGRRPLADFEARDLEAWKREMLIKPPASKRALDNPPVADREAIRRRRKSTNTYLGLIKQALDHAYLKGRAGPGQPWKDVVGFSNSDPRRPRVLQDAEIEALLQYASTEFAVFLRGLLLTGCRGSELMRADVQDYSIASQKLRIMDGKHHRVRSVIIGPEGEQIFSRLVFDRPGSAPLLARFDGRRWSDSAQNWEFYKAKKAAGLDPAISIRSTRHTYATRAALGGMPIRFLAQQLGHLNIATTERYYVQFEENEVDRGIRANLPSILGSVSEPSAAN